MLLTCCWKLVKDFSCLANVPSRYSAWAHYDDGTHLATMTPSLKHTTAGSTSHRTVLSTLSLSLLEPPSVTVTNMVAGKSGANFLKCFSRRTWRARLR